MSDKIAMEMDTNERPLERPSPNQQMVLRAKKNLSLQVGAFVFLTIFFVSTFAPLIAPHDPYIQDLSRRLIDPIWAENGTWEHILGTDSLGRDYLSRLIYGSRIALLIGISAMIISGVIGTILGVSAGYFGGRTDSVISFLILNRLSLPVTLVALAVVSLLGNSLILVIIVLGLLIWDRFAVVLRSATMQVKNMEYVSAAQVLGASTPRIIFKEILPNISNHLIVVATLEMAHAILLEAALSFLGLGVQPPLPSWGAMVSQGREFLFFKPWMITIPGVALFLLVLAINMLGDGLRDVTTPEGRN